MNGSEELQLAEIARDLRRHLEWARASGETTLPQPRPGATDLPAGPMAGDAISAAPSVAPTAAPFEAAPRAIAVPVQHAASGATAPRGQAPRRPGNAPTTIGGGPPPHVVGGASVGGRSTGGTAGAVPVSGPVPPGPTAPIMPTPRAGAVRASNPGPQRPGILPLVPVLPDHLAQLSHLRHDRGIDAIRAELGDCRRCALCEGRRNLVYGAGNPRAELVFVGEGPGADEDEQGIPFVGKSGQLLTRMIAAMGYGRDEVYICNVVKCRPPGNRGPLPEEIAACEPFLLAQLAAIQPKAIVALGKFAAQTLLRDSTPITGLRGQWREYQGIPLMPTYHPAYLLRAPAEKASVWEDLKKVMAHLGKERPGRR